MRCDLSRFVIGQTLSYGVALDVLGYGRGSSLNPVIYTTTFVRHSVPRHSDDGPISR